MLDPEPYLSLWQNERIHTSAVRIKHAFLAIQELSSEKRGQSNSRFKRYVFSISTFVFKREYDNYIMISTV